MIDRTYTRAEVDALVAENERLRDSLKGIDIYLSDTLSGRVIRGPETYTEWLVEGIREARNRARAALTGEKGNG